jgi:hypothetical protein
MKKRPSDFRGGLGLRERLHALAPVAAAVLAMRAERAREELGRHLVVLLVGLLGQQRDRGRVHARDEGLVGFLGGLGVGRVHLGQALLEQAADAQPDDAVGHQALFDPADGAGGGSGGHAGSSAGRIRPSGGIRSRAPIGFTRRHPAGLMR